MISVMIRRLSDIGLFEFDAGGKARHLLRHCGLCRDTARCGSRYQLERNVLHSVSTFFSHTRLDGVITQDAAV